MNRTVLKTLLIALLLGLSACAEKTTVTRKDQTNTGNNPSTGGNNNGGGNNYDGGGGGDGHGDGSEPGIDDGGQTLEYYTISNIVVHGKGNPNRHAASYPNGILWSSQVDFPSTDRHIFFTDTRFNLRVLARRGPSQNTEDVKGINCHYNNDVYQKLEIDVCVRSINGSCNNFNTVTFSDVPINQASKVKEFPVPATSDPLVVEIRDVQWDYTCTYYGENVPGYCPYAPVWDTQCVKFDFQFSTDETKDVPGPRL